MQYLRILSSKNSGILIFILIFAVIKDTYDCSTNIIRCIIYTHKILYESKSASEIYLVLFDRYNADNPMFVIKIWHFYVW